MAALKWLVVIVCGVGALGLMGLGLKASTGLRSIEPMTVATAKVSLRPLPAAFTPGAAPVLTPPVAAKPVAVEPVVEAADAGVAVIRDAGVAVKADAGVAVAAAKPAVVDAGVKPVVAAPVAPAPVVPVAAPAPAATTDAILNLRASDTADVFVDGKRVGSSPVLGVKVKVGAHKVRFDCYDAAGNTLAGAVQTVTATADKDLDVAFTCPASE